MMMTMNWLIFEYCLVYCRLCKPLTINFAEWKKHFEVDRETIFSQGGRETLRRWTKDCYTPGTMRCESCSDLYNRSALLRIRRHQTKRCAYAIGVWHKQRTRTSWVGKYIPSLLALFYHWLYMDIYVDGCIRANLITWSSKIAYRENIWILYNECVTCNSAYLWLFQLNHDNALDWGQ